MSFDPSQLKGTWKSESGRKLIIVDIEHAIVETECPGLQSSGTFTGWFCQRLSPARPTRNGIWYVHRDETGSGLALSWFVDWPETPGSGGAARTTWNGLARFNDDGSVCALCALHIGSLTGTRAQPVTGRTVFLLESNATRKGAADADGLVMEGEAPTCLCGAGCLCGGA